MNEYFERSRKILSFPLVFAKKEYTSIPLINKSNDVRIYRGATIVTPGVWSDMITNAPVLYTPEVLKKFATNWDSNYLDLGHDIGNPLSIIGTVQNQRWEDNGVKGDLYISQLTQNGRDVVSLIDAGLVNHLSVEMTTKDYWDPKEMVRCADDIIFLGVAVVGPYPACKDAKIK